MITFKIEVALTDDLIPQTTAEVVDLANTMVEKFRPILTEVIKAVQERTDAPGLLKQIDTNETPLLRPVEGLLRLIVNVWMLEIPLRKHAHIIYSDFSRL